MVDPILLFKYLTRERIDPDIPPILSIFQANHQIPSQANALFFQRQIDQFGGNGIQRDAPIVQQQVLRRLTSRITNRLLNHQRLRDLHL